MTNLIESWIAAQTQCGEPLSIAIEMLNNDLGAHYDSSRISAWRNGRRSIPEPVKRYMLEHALFHVLINHGLPVIDLPDNDEAYESMTAALSPPNR